MSDLIVASTISWNARSPRNTRRITTPTEFLVGHNTVGLYRGAAGMRSMQNFHMDTRGWWDVAYSFCLDSVDKTLYELRGGGVSGAHTPGMNSVAHAIAVTGNYMTREVTDELFEALCKSVAYGKEQGYWKDSFTSGHRDHSRTSCPGDNLYAVLNDVVSELPNVSPVPPQPAEPDPIVDWFAELVASHNWVRRDSRNRAANRRVQSALAAHGHPPANTFRPNGEPDGVAGSGTDRAIRNFQSASNLLTDGIAGPATLGALFPSPWRLVSRRHNSHELRNKLTQALLAATKMPPARTFNSHGEPDGIIGQNTHDTIRTFQQSQRLQVDGIVGRQTVTKLLTL